MKEDDFATDCPQCIECGLVHSIRAKAIAEETHAHTCAGLTRECIEKTPPRSVGAEDVHFELDAMLRALNFVQHRGQAVLAPRKKFDAIAFGHHDLATPDQVL